MTFHYISQKPYADALIMAATEVYSLLQWARAASEERHVAKKHTQAPGAKHNLQYWFVRLAPNRH